MSFAQMVHIFLKFWFAAIVATVLVILGLVLPIAILGMAFEIVFSSYTAEKKYETYFTPYRNLNLHKTIFSLK